MLLNAKNDLYMLQCAVKCNALTSSYIFISNTVRVAISGTKHLPDIEVFQMLRMLRLMYICSIHSMLTDRPNVHLQYT
jgi:hypothetical protein